MTVSRVACDGCGGILVYTATSAMAELARDLGSRALCVECALDDDSHDEIARVTATHAPMLERAPLPQRAPLIGLKERP